ncbi:MAG TPA: hypothetical protein VFD43_04475, partial [Planctomycetota bacterium]|nr:hypothetical protein [Planctomycetota bacterium]
PQSAQLTAGLRKLLEAKDCFVRARLVDPTAGGASQPPTTPAPRPGGLIDVGEASGKRGEEVAVEIR